MRPHCFLKALIIALMITLELPAQVTTASILGTVRDGLGAVLPNVIVTAIQLETNFTWTVKTDGFGQYSIQFLPLGTYRVEVDADGFKKFQQSGVVLDVGRNARVDATLDLGAVTESVEVTSDAPLVNTTDPGLGRTVQNEEVTSLPLVNRDLYGLLHLTPGHPTSVEPVTPDTVHASLLIFPELARLANSLAHWVANDLK